MMGKDRAAAEAREWTEDNSRLPRQLGEAAAHPLGVGEGPCLSRGWGIDKCAA